MGLILPEKRKFREAEQILKKLYMYPNLTPDCVAQLDFLASCIRTQMTDQVPAKKVTDESHGLVESSSGISGKLTAKLKFLFNNFGRLPKN